LLLCKSSVTPWHKLVETIDFVVSDAFQNPVARAALRKYLAFYNTRRPHSSLDRQTPDQACFNVL
jgi:transposase InsO family protein